MVVDLLDRAPLFSRGLPLLLFARVPTYPSSPPIRAKLRYLYCTTPFSDRGQQIKLTQLHPEGREAGMGGTAPNRCRNGTLFHGGRPPGSSATLFQGSTPFALCACANLSLFAPNSGET